MSGVLNPAPLDPRSQSYNGDECPQQRRRWWESLPPRHARRRATRAGETGRDGAGGDVREDPWPGTARVAPADFRRGLVLCWPYDVTISGRWCFASEFNRQRQVRGRVWLISGETTPPLPHPLVRHGVMHQS
jgi:hypothetical protein